MVDSRTEQLTQISHHDSGAIDQYEFDELSYTRRKERNRQTTTRLDSTMQTRAGNACS